MFYTSSVSLDCVQIKSALNLLVTKEVLNAHPLIQLVLVPNIQRGLKLLSDLASVECLSELVSKTSSGVAYKVFMKIG